MATNVTMILSRMLKTLRENTSVKEKREALTYISSQAKKLESSGVIKEERYKEICKLVLESFAQEEGNIQYEALGALTAIVQEFQAHPLQLFESMLRTDKRTRLKILKLLEVVEDNAISAAANDRQALSFFKDCMVSVQPSLMEWITPTACADNLQMLTKVEHHVLSDEQKLEEDTIAYSLTLLRRLYKLAAITFDTNVERFDTLLLDKIVILAYMGHKRQRGSALKVLQQAIATNVQLRIRKDHSELWAQYKSNLQSMYCKRMLLLVAACETDWCLQWNITIQLLGTDLHRGANLINNLLSVEEKAFKSTDTIIRRQAFLSWKLLIDNFALDNLELATARRIKLLCIPLNAKNSKTELISLTKLEVWWHLIIKLYKDIVQFATPVITQFLNFCFGPLGDTPLLSSNFDAVASPGKRFLKTKLVALDALCQLVVPKEDHSIVCAPMLEERLPHAITHEVFQECSKIITYSIGEALLILGQLVDQEMKNRHQLGKILWSSLVTYIKCVKMEKKDHLCKDVILVVTELGNHFDKSMVKDMIFNVILPDLLHIIVTTELIDNALLELALKLLSLPVLCEMPKSFNCDLIECLLQKCISSETSNALGFLQKIMLNLKSANDTHKNTIHYLELWSIIAEILTKYIVDHKKIDEGDKNGHNFKTVKSVLLFPFQYTNLEKSEQMQNRTKLWKTLYKHFELQSGLISTVKPNEILLDIASSIRSYLNINNCWFIVDVSDALLSTINYEYLLAQVKMPSIMLLMVDAATIALNNPQSFNCEGVLNKLSAMLITIFGHDKQKIVPYLQISKPIIEFALKSQLKALNNEIESFWEIIINIFKGLDQQLHQELYSLYNEIFLTAAHHPNLRIQCITRPAPGKRILDSTPKCVLDETEKMVEKSPSQLKCDSVTKNKEETEKAKEVRVVGSFLSRKSVNTKPVSNKPLERDEKKKLILPDPDSQDYVYIKTDLKFDINRLTEHQKETLKKKREDIPALYNDLSQSSSQNSQNLQDWFDMQTKHINELDKVNSKKSEFLIQKPINSDANKENNITVIQSELHLMDKTINNNNSSKLDGNVGDNVADVKSKANSTKETAREDTSCSHGENKSEQVALDSPLFAGFNSPLETDTNVMQSTVSVVKRLNFESREEFPEDEARERQSSPSMFDSAKRRHRSDKIDVTKSNSSSRNDETNENQKDSSVTNIVQKTSKTKCNQEKPGTSHSQKPQDDSDIKVGSNENKKGVKRKFMSDIESDGVLQQRRKRKLTPCSKDVNDDDGDKSRDSDNVSLDTIGKDGLSQRMRNEISRLKIDMVFDCPSVNRRRLKHMDEGDKELLKKTWSLDDKNLALKFLEAKSAEASKKSLKVTEKNTKDGKEGNDTNQGPKKRGRRSTKQEPDKNDDVNKEAKKSNDTIDKVLSLKNSADTDATRVVPTTSQVMQDVTDRIQDEILEKDDSKSISNKDEESSKVPEPNEPSQDEMEDVVESSQAPSTCIKLDKKYGEKHKKCFIKINKITDVHAAKTPDVAAEKNYVPESIPMDCGDNDVPDPCEQPSEADTDNNKETIDVGNKDSTSKDAIQETDNSNEKVPVAEGQKAVDGSSSIKPTCVVNFSSPKSSGKVFSKLKSFTVHGRAAHMLGLVTMQSRIEADNSTVEDDSSIKKSKTKDTETETSANKKVSTVKELDKIGGPSGSRQEKIFNNMRSSDYCLSPSTYMFTNLKNDGEKLSSKLDKSMSDSVSTDSSVDKQNEENTSLLCEKDDLPILEWSSANPPSLTASPSASILKRHRSIVPEVDPDSVTPNKRKRVSFADPPVSKEMGYEVSVADSPHKSTKLLTTRSLTPKKDSPLRYKQLKLKLTPADAEKSTAEGDAPSESSAEVTSQADQSQDQNQHQVLCYEVVQGPEPMNCVEMEDSETQQDIFDGLDTKNNNSSLMQTTNDGTDTFIHNNSVESVKLSVTNDSVIDVALPTKEDNLEDTVDIQNVMGLNSTVNTDEVFYAKLSHGSSTYAKNLAEQDTLPATDSMFASLPSSQDSRCENLNNVELDPEFLDSIQPIYPTLSSCREPIDVVVERLITPLWKQHLHAYLTNRNLFTIGDLAQLSEREVNRMPVKGKPKVEFVRKVLRHYESTSGIACRKESDPTCAYMPRAKISDKTDQLLATTAAAAAAATSDETTSVSVAPVSDFIEAASSLIGNESLSCSTPLARPVDRKLLDNASTEKLLGEQSDSAVSMNSDVNISPECGNSDLSALDASAVNEEAIAKVPITAHSSPGKSARHGCKSTMLPIATSSVSKNLVTTTEVPSSDIINVSAIICDEPFITHSSIGVGTDEGCSSKPAVEKTTRSVESQMALEDLLDEIDVNVVLESAVRRCNAETILSQYKMKMGPCSEQELVKETIRMLSLQNKRQLNDALLRTICHTYGINNVLLRLPDVFNSDQQFFERVFRAYYKKLNIVDCLNVFDPTELKNAICQKFTSSELVQMLSDKLKQEEQEGIKQPICEVSSLNAMLQRLPRDVIISHTVANEEVIPASVVLDIALQNNKSEDIVHALSSQSPSRVKHVLNQLWSSHFNVAHIENVSKETLLDIFKGICSKLTAQELLNVYHEAMTSKLTVKEDNN